MAMFINSDCTESLLEQRYYKIDSKQLSIKIPEEVETLSTECTNIPFIREPFKSLFYSEVKEKTQYLKII